MAQTIDIEYQGTPYTLEFTRKTVELMEKQGFRISDLESKPLTTFSALFAGAFLAHHKFIKKEIVDEIFSKLPKKEELMGKLADMYTEPVIAMMDEPEESEGNITWGASW